MFLSRNKKNNVYPCKPQLYYIKVGFKVVKIISACFRDVLKKSSSFVMPWFWVRKTCKNNILLLVIFCYGIHPVGTWRLYSRMTLQWTLIRHYVNVMCFLGNICKLCLLKKCYDILFESTPNSNRLQIPRYIFFRNKWKKDEKYYLLNIQRKKVLMPYDWNKQSWAKYAGPRSTASDQGPHCLPLAQQLFNTSACGKMGLFKLKNKYGKVSKYLGYSDSQPWTNNRHPDRGVWLMSTFFVYHPPI